MLSQPITQFGPFARTLHVKPSFTKQGPHTRYTPFRRLDELASEHAAVRHWN